MQEISLNVLDIAQNSIVAGADLIEIGILEDTKKDILTVQVSDNGKGMSSEVRKAAADPFYTTRTTRRVGLGIPLFQMAAEQTGGGLTIDSREGEGTKITATFGYSHIDRQPLGDIVQTLITLIVSNPTLDFVYRHEADGGCFDFDTRQIKEQLGEVPINTGEVVAWIKEYIAEGINGLSAQL